MYTNTFTGNEFQGVEKIGNIIWHKQPLVYVELMNMINKEHVKIVSE